MASQQPFKVELSFWDGRTYRIFNCRPGRADGRSVGGISINHFRREICISPRATEAALGRAIIALLYFVVDDSPDKGDKDYEVNARFVFTGAGKVVCDIAYFRCQITPRIHAGKVYTAGAWFVDPYICVTPWATYAEIGRAVVDAIAESDPMGQERRWLRPKSDRVAADQQRPSLYIPRNMGA